MVVVVVVGVSARLTDILLVLVGRACVQGLKLSNDGLQRAHRLGKASSEAGNQKEVVG